MELLKGWHSKSRLSLVHKNSNDSLESMADRQLTEKSSSTEDTDSSIIRNTPSFIKSRSSICLEDPNLPLKYKELFVKGSKETLLKRYKCSLIDANGSLPGKLYISNNFLCFVTRTKKMIKFVMRLEDVQAVDTIMTGELKVTSNGEMRHFVDFERPESALSFLSNFLRLSIPASSNSTSESTSLDSLASSSVHGHHSVEDNKSSTPAEQTGSNGTKFSTSVSPIAVSSPSANSTPKKAPIHGLYKRDNMRGSPVRASPYEDVVSGISDVAYKASCIPLMILAKLLSFGMQGVQFASGQLPLPFGCPPKSFTRLIAYAVLAFLAVSMAYMYLRLDGDPRDRRNPPGTPPIAERSCDGELTALLISLEKLTSSVSDSLNRLERRLIQH